MHGPPYTSNSTAQSFSLTLLCDPDASNSDPTFISYDGAELRLEWSSPAGCPFGESSGGGGGPSDGPAEESVGSGVGWFFLVSVSHILLLYYY